MGIHNLKEFIEANCPNACVPVDLLKIARGLAVGKRQGGSGPNRVLDNRLCLVIDGECCLDRLYGGFYSDWACGGQWNRMLQFLSVLVQTIHTNNIEIVVFFNGCLEPQRMSEWIKLQLHERQKVNQIIKHVGVRATPPPKVWWVPPVCLRSCLRTALRHLNVPVMFSMDDHHQEVIGYCRENFFHGIIAEDSEYTIFDPPRYFSSEQLKLTYKGSLETRETLFEEVAKGMNLHPKRFCVLAALLGNYLLNDNDLSNFYQSLVPESSNKQLNGDALIKSVVAFVRSLPSVDDVDAIGSQVFGPPQHSPTNQRRIQKFKECVQYYLNGTKDGFLRYRPPAHGGRRYEFGNQLQGGLGNLKQTNQPKIVIKQKSSSQNNHVITTNPSETGKFASETDENHMMTLSAYKEATALATVPAPEIVIEPPSSSNKEKSSSATCDNDAGGQNKTAKLDGNSLSNSVSSSSSDSSPSRISPDVSNWSIEAGKKAENANESTEEKSQPVQRKNIQFPKIPPEVMRTASERHQKGLMSPWIYQILTQGEVKLPVTIEEDVPKELPSGAILFRPLRSMVYAVLYNVHHMAYMAKTKGESEKSVPDILVKEWVWSKSNPYRSPEVVKPVQLDWKVPTVQRLWFGSVLDDKRRRMRAFLTCMRSDTPLMLKTSHVPQHLLVLCCVLRYMLSDKGMRVLRKQELDAFLAQAVSPQLMDAQNVQLMQLPLVTNRGIQLASLFMQGVEHALLANDACGAPIPLLICCVWLFFDGKLFHEKLLKAHTAKNLTDICGGQLDQVVKVERMRRAILENLSVQFAHPPIGMMGGGHFGNVPPNAPAPPPPPMSGNSINRGRGKKIYARGGQLEIAGVVVGSWGANYGQVPARSRGMPFATNMMQGGGPPRRPGGLNLNRNYPQSNLNNRFMQTQPSNVGRGRRFGPPPFFKGGNKPTNRKFNSKKNDKPTKVNSHVRLPAGRGCTVDLPNDSLNEGLSNKSKVPVQNGNGKYDDAEEYNKISSESKTATIAADTSSDNCIDSSEPAAKVTE